VPLYTYRGRDASLAPVSGSLEAESPAKLVEQLVAKGVAVTEVSAAADAVAAPQVAAPWWEKFRFDTITDDDVILFSRQMYALQRTNVPILRALAGLQDSTVNPAFADVLGEVRSSLEKGRELSAAMARHPRVFSDFYVAMIRVGEISGRLAEVFNRLYTHLEFEKDVRGQIKTALRYPSFVLIAGGIALAILNLFVIPVFAGVFAGFNAKLPLMTRVLITFSEWTVRWWPAILAALAGGVFGLRTLLASPDGRYWWDAQKLRLPIIGRIVLRATLARFARSFALASQSGIPVLQALAVVARTTDNAYVGRKIEGLRAAIDRGDSLYHSAVASGVFTPVVLQMIAVGEETGEIDALLTEIAGMYERETAYSIKELSTVIEPLLLVVMALLVLALALGVFMPMWSLGQAALGRGG
jgi:MSHA biogenesis protein MshG